MAMSPAERAALISGLFGVGSGIAGAIGQGRASAANLQATQGGQYAQSLLGLLNTDADMRQYFGNQGMLGAKAGVALGPLAVQQALGNNAMKRAFYFGGEGGRPQYITPGDPAIASQMGKLPSFTSAARYFSDAAVANDPYWKAYTQLSQGQLTPNFAGMGMTGIGNAQGELDEFGRTQSNLAAQEKGDWQNQVGATRMALMQALNQEQAAKQQQKKKSGFWGKLGGVLKVAAPIAASFLPGGALVAALATGGMNALGTKMQGGSWKDAALSGALGGASGYAADKWLPNLGGVFGKKPPINYGYGGTVRA